MKWARDVLGFNLDKLKNSEAIAADFLDYSAKGLEKKFGISEREAKMIFKTVQFINNRPDRGRQGINLLSIAQ